MAGTKPPRKPYKPRRIGCMAIIDSAARAKSLMEPVWRVIRDIRIGVLKTDAKGIPIDVYRGEHIPLSPLISGWATVAYYATGENTDSVERIAKRIEYGLHIEGSDLDDFERLALLTENALARLSYRQAKALLDKSSIAIYLQNAGLAERKAA